MKLEYGCWECGSGKRHRKSVPFGSKRNLIWCSHCDRDLVTTINKKAARQKMKKEIQEELKMAA